MEDIIDENRPMRQPGRHGAKAARATIEPVSAVGQCHTFEQWQTVGGDSCDEILDSNWATPSIVTARAYGYLWVLLAQKHASEMGSALRGPVANLICAVGEPTAITNHTYEW